jgi:hypothetical protein
MATKDVAAYANANGELTDWHGAVILSGRPATIKRYRLRDGETEAVVIRFGNCGRAIAGYSLGEGMLFRGELCYANEDAEQTARNVSEYWIDRDAEDEQQFDYEQSLAESEAE